MPARSEPSASTGLKNLPVLLPGPRPAPGSQPGRGPGHRHGDSQPRPLSPSSEPLPLSPGLEPLQLPPPSGLPATQVAVSPAARKYQCLPIPRIKQRRTYFAFSRSSGPPADSSRGKGRGRRRDIESHGNQQRCTICIAATCSLYYDNKGAHRMYAILNTRPTS